MYLSHEFPTLTWRSSFLQEMYGNAAIRLPHLLQHSQRHPSVDALLETIVPSLSFPQSFPFSFPLSSPLSFPLSSPLSFLLCFLSHFHSPPLSDHQTTRKTRKTRTSHAHRTHNSPCSSKRYSIQHRQHASRKSTAPAIQMCTAVLTIFKRSTKRWTPGTSPRARQS